MLILLLFFQLNDDVGYLTVTADLDSLPVFVDDDLIGSTPVLKYALKADEYNVGFFPQDSVEAASWRLKDGSLGALWKIARYSEGIVKVRIVANSVTTVVLNYKKVQAAPGKAKLKVFGCLGGTFVLGVISGVVVRSLRD
jgi:hypothetical protein